MDIKNIDFLISRNLWSGKEGVNILHAGQHDYKSTPIYIGHSAGVLYFPVDGRSMPGDEGNSTMHAVSGIPNVPLVRKRNKLDPFSDARKTNSYLKNVRNTENFHKRSCNKYLYKSSENLLYSQIAVTLRRAMRNLRRNI